MHSPGTGRIQNMHSSHRKFTHILALPVQTSGVLSRTVYNSFMQSYQHVKWFVSSSKHSCTAQHPSVSDCMANSDVGHILGQTTICLVSLSHAIDPAVAPVGAVHALHFRSMSQQLRCNLSRRLSQGFGSWKGSCWEVSQRSLEARLSLRSTMRRGKVPQGHF